MIEVGSKEWLEARRSLVTATDVPILMGVSPWCTPLQLYWRKKKGEEIKANAAMQRGTNLEPQARKIFEERFGEEFPPLFKISRRYPWLAASFDGINEISYLEIKCPGEADHLSALSEIIPEKYVPQFQAQSIVSEHEHGYYMSYRPEHESPVATILEMADKRMQEEILEVSKEFYDRLMSDSPPEPGERDIIQRSDREWLLLEEELAGLLRTEEEVEERKEVVKKKLIALTDGKPTRGYRLKLTPISRKGNVDYSAIPEIKGINLEAYRKPGSVSWRIDQV